MKRQKPEVGDLFTVPLPDGTFALGQIVARETPMLNSWTCAFSRVRIPKEEMPIEALRLEDVISVQFVNGDLLKKGIWKIHGWAAVIIPRVVFPFEEFREQKWIGATMRGSGIMNTFLAAFHGLEFWDEMKDPDYYQTLLLPGVCVPDEIKRKTA